MSEEGQVSGDDLHPAADAAQGHLCPPPRHGVGTGHTRPCEDLSGSVNIVTRVP